MLPSFAPAARLRPITIVRAGPLGPHPALEATPIGGTGDPLSLTLTSGTVRLTATYGDRVSLTVDDGERTTEHRPRRRVRVRGPVDRVALALTGDQLTALTRSGGVWTARARVDLRGRVATRDEEWIAGLHADATGLTDLIAGTFGQLGLRDPRLVTEVDGTPYRLDGRLLLTLTSAGPGFFETAHTSLWSLDPASLELTHRSDLFFRRPDRPGAYGDSATHLVHDGDTWLAATSTWGDFRVGDRGASVRVTLARTSADLTTGLHVLDAEPLALPTDGLASAGVWDPHLVRDGDQWLVAFVGARRFFDFFPVVAQGPSLSALTLRSADTERRATEGTTLLDTDDGWRVLASDGRDGRRGQRAAYPVFDLDLSQLGTLDAPYPSNIPWPTLAPLMDGGALLIGFDGSAQGGRLVGYGSHGDLVIARSV